MTHHNLRCTQNHHDETQPARGHACRCPQRQEPGAGTLSDLEGSGDYVLDDRFAAKVLMPGFVEGHAHTMEGALCFMHVGWFDGWIRRKVWPGLKSIDAVVTSLAKPSERWMTRTVLGWGLTRSI